MAEKSYVCGYKHCLHKDTKVNESDAITINKKRYHKDCVAVMETIKLIKDTYIEKVDNEVDFKVLMRAINDIIFKKGESADFLLFALEETIRRGAGYIKSPYSMHYFPKNMILKEKWRNKNNADRQWLN